MNNKLINPLVITQLPTVQIVCDLAKMGSFALHFERNSHYLAQKEVELTHFKALKV